VDQQRHELAHLGVRLRIHGKVYDFLMALIRQRGKIVAREELRRSLWPAKTLVNSDANVNATANKLRHVLDDSPKNPMYIETIPRFGYSFIAELEYSSVPFPKIETMPETTEVFPEGQIFLPLEKAAGRTFFKHWPMLGVGLLFLVGMLFGAGLAALWIAHFALGARLF
jgi:DNA-binding winged helix-turn-helix (wHTH) protein